MAPTASPAGSRSTAYLLDGFGPKADEKLAGFIHIATSSKPAEDRNRPALSEIVTRF